MRMLFFALMVFGLGTSAAAYQPTLGCDFRFHGGTRPIPKTQGYQVVAIGPEYQEIQIFGQSRAQYQTERRPAWDGGPMELVQTEIRPVKSSQTQRKMIRPAYFMIKDAENRNVGQFEKASDVQNYVCQVIIPTYGNVSQD